MALMRALSAVLAKCLTRRLTGAQRAQQAPTPQTTIHFVDRARQTQSLWPGVQMFLPVFANPVGPT